jgi:hypothetical protein
MERLVNMPLHVRAAVATLAAGAVLGTGCSKPTNKPEPFSSKQSITTNTVTPSTSQLPTAQVCAPGLLSIEQSTNGTYTGICENGFGGTNQVYSPSAQQLEDQCLGR